MNYCSYCKCHGSKCQRKAFIIQTKNKTFKVIFFATSFTASLKIRRLSNLLKRIIFHPIRNEKWQLNFKEYKELHLNQNENARFFENNNEKGFKENMEIQNPILSVVNTSEKLEIYQIWIFSEYKNRYFECCLIRPFKY